MSVCGEGGGVGVNVGVDSEGGGVRVWPLIVNQQASTHTILLR